PAPATAPEDTRPAPETEPEAPSTEPETETRDTRPEPDDTSIEPEDTSTETETRDTSPEPETHDTSPATDTTIGPEPLPPADASLLSAPPYLMWVTSSEVSVRWETTTPVVGRVDFGPSDALGLTVEEPSARTTHELRLTGLPAANLNSYRVVYGGGALPIRRFRTAPLDDAETEEPMRFIVWGDNQNGPSNFTKLTALMAELEPDFAISVGDCVQNGTRSEYRSQLFKPLAGTADQVPFLVAAGNHERYGDSDASLFGEYFSQPGDEHCFGWRYGELFVLFLDTDLPLDGTGGQRACVEAALTSPAALGASIQAAAFHKPPRVEWWVGGFLAFTDAMEAPWVREDLEPLLEQHGVDLVFNGHNHLYAHTPETDGGITWVTTGGGGGLIDTRGVLDIWRVGNWPEIETTLHQFHFLLVELHVGEAFVQAFDIDGEVIHAFFTYGD
ncbi:MAG: metallophosphoesterase, partial [Deltaproteobacteria bacterium]|nr:metallophosphoesterase [Deltaproteobacteria bacterium]